MELFWKVNFFGNLMELWIFFTGKHFFLSQTFTWFRGSVSPSSLTAIWANRETKAPPYRCRWEPLYGRGIKRPHADKGVASEMESSKCCREELCCHPTPWAWPPSLPFLHTCTWEWQGEFFYHLHLCGLLASTVSLETRIGPGRKRSSHTRPGS